MKIIWNSPIIWTVVKRDGKYSTFNNVFCSDVIDSDSLDGIFAAIKKGMEALFDKHKDENKFIGIAKNRAANITIEPGSGVTIPYEIKFHDHIHFEFDSPIAIPMELYSFDKIIAIVGPSPENKETHTIHETLTGTVIKSSINDGRELDRNPLLD